MQQFDSTRKSVSSAPALPHNLEAEQGLLGALLFDNEVFRRVRELTPEDFFDPVHGRIFTAIRDLVRAGQLADAVTLKDRFAKDSGIAEIGGARYLMRLLEHAAPLSAQAMAYADLIYDLSVRRSMVRAGQEAIRLALAPPADLDAADVLMEAQRAFASIHGGSKSYVTLREAGENVAADLKGSAPRGLRTGLSKLDGLLGGGLFAPDLVILAGRPAMGKTALADNICANMAQGGAVVGMFSMEMAPEQIAARVLSRRSGGRFPYSSLRLSERRSELAGVVAPLTASLPETLLIDPTSAQTLGGIESSALAMKRRTRRLDAIVVDYLQLMRDAPSRKAGRVQELSEITAGLKSLAKRLNVPVIALSQLSRAVEQRADKRPQLSDLRESGSIEQDADIVLFVYREHYYLERESIIPFDGEEDFAFEKRREQRDFRLAQTANEFELFVGKNRHAGGGSEKLWCDLSMDDIADDWPDRTPHVSRARQDGVS